MSTARHTYVRHVSGGVYPPHDLRRGEDLLLALQLVREQEGILYPADELSELAALMAPVAEETLVALYVERIAPDLRGQELIWAFQAAHVGIAELFPDPLRREVLLTALGERFDPAELRELGELGEEHVAATARAELMGCGREDLADQVQRVSLVSDELGYDVVAPRTDGGLRRLEVKTAAHSDEGRVHFYLSRSEAEVGARDANWALVCCEGKTRGEVQIAGWTRGRSLIPYLPSDVPGGRWRTVEIDLPRSILLDGIPPGVY